MSRVMMVDIPDATREDIHTKMLQTIAAFRRQVARHNSREFGTAILISCDMALEFLDPEDMVRLSGIGRHDVRYIGTFAGYPIFATGTRVNKTNGLITWDSAQTPDLGDAVADFYRGFSGHLPHDDLPVIDMRDYRSPLEGLPQTTPVQPRRSILLDAEDVERIMSV